jgi:hypothetical protein
MNEMISTLNFENFPLNENVEIKGNVTFLNLNII